MKVFSFFRKKKVSISRVLQLPNALSFIKGKPKSSFLNRQRPSFFKKEGGLPG